MKLWRPDTLALERTVKMPQAEEESEFENEGFTGAVLWSNMIVATAWDGVMRIFAYTEE